MSGNHSATSNFNKDILIKDLGLEQDRNTSVYTRYDAFVLSPAIQNESLWFDLREVNIRKYDEHSWKGFLLIRFFTEFILIDLDTFLEEMISDEDSVYTQNSGKHWKFLIHPAIGKKVTITNQRRKDCYFAAEILMVEEMKTRFEMLSRGEKYKTIIPVAPTLNKMDETKVAKMIVEEQIQFVEKMYEDLLQLDVTKSKAKQIISKIIDETARVCSGRMASFDNIGIVDIKVNEMINEFSRILSKHTKTIQDNNLSEKRIFEIVAQYSQIELQKFYTSDQPVYSSNSSSNKSGCLGASSSFLLFVVFPIVLFFIFY